MKGKWMKITVAASFPALTLSLTPCFSNAAAAEQVTSPQQAFGFAPGTDRKVSVDTSNPIGFGSPATVPVFFENSPTFKVSGNAPSVAHYASDNPLLSGWILGGKYLKGTSAVAEEPVGKGRIVLCGLRPQDRALSEVTYELFFNALLESSSTPVALSNGVMSRN
jgi:hypothetical protein